MEQHHETDQATPLLRQHPNPLYDDSTLHRAYAATTVFFAFLAEWLILILTFSIAMFIIPLSPAFTLHSTTASVLNITGENHFTANLGMEIRVDDPNPFGSTIYYDDSLHASLFHRQENLSTFSLPPSSSSHHQEQSASSVKAEFLNVSLMIDEWSMEDHGIGSCGYVYLDLWFNVSARFTQPLWPVVKDKLQGHCGELKIELCSSSSSSSSVTATTVLHPFHASCDVSSDVAHRVRLVLLLMLIFLLVTALVVYLLVELPFLLLIHLSSILILI